MQSEMVQLCERLAPIGAEAIRQMQNRAIIGVVACGVGLLVGVFALVAGIRRGKRLDWDDVGAIFATICGAVVLPLFVGLGAVCIVDYIYPLTALLRH